MGRSIGEFTEEKLSKKIHTLGVYFFKTWENVGFTFGADLTFLGK